MINQVLNTATVGIDWGDAGEIPHKPYKSLFPLGGTRWQVGGRLCIEVIDVSLTVRPEHLPLHRARIWAALGNQTAPSFDQRPSGPQGVCLTGPGNEVKMYSPILLELFAPNSRHQGRDYVPMLVELLPDAFSDDGVGLPWQGETNRSRACPAEQNRTGRNARGGGGPMPTKIRRSFRGHRRPVAA